jgi:hypothetical protein
MTASVYDETKETTCPKYGVRIKMVCPWDGREIKGNEEPER